MLGRLGVGLALAVVGMGLLMSVPRSGVDAQRETIASHPTIQRTPDSQKATFPSIEYSPQPATDNRKSIKYEKSMRVLSTELSKDGDSLSHIRWYAGLAPLPVASSELVITGVVEQVQANLSPNKGTVFSTVAIRVSDIFKKPTTDKPGALIEAEREGGIVVYPSGCKFWHRLAGQQIPTVGEEYLFFLTHSFPGIGVVKDDLYLLTAYKLSGGSVRSLDDPGGSNGIFSVYNGRSRTEILDDLRVLVND